MDILDSDTNKIAISSYRKTSMAVSGVSLPLPCFFPSISSVKSNLKLLEYLRVIRAVGHPLFLFSAYDLHHSNRGDSTIIKNILAESVQAGTAVLIDSGNYESYWIRDSSWRRQHYWSCLTSCDYGFAFHFDKRPHAKKYGTVASLADEIEKGVLKDQAKANKGTVIPIIHAQSTMLPDVSAIIATRLNPMMIAIPERELGDGIIERSITVAKIRKALDERGQYYPLHLLGTGNPLSIMMYVMCGADSFDGLEWCQTTVNYENALLYHFHQRELFGPQVEFDSFDIPYTQATLAHNLRFYSLWMKRIQDHLGSGSIFDLARHHLKKELLESFKEKLSRVKYGR
jgi:queuine/archaeosine tRNA-ribosyltransferase